MTWPVALLPGVQLRLIWELERAVAVRLVGTVGAALDVVALATFEGNESPASLKAFTW
jgi:hypothetical protein